MTAFLLVLLALAVTTHCATEVAEISPPTLSPGASFGYGLAAYDTFVIVGAPFDSSLTNVSSSGSAYIYNCPTPDKCEQTLTLSPPNAQVNSTFGSMVGVYESLVAVGASKANDNRGAVYVYRCVDASNCTLGSIITPDDIEAGDEFGWYVVVYGDWVVSGSGRHNNSTGSAYLYNCSDVTNCTLAFAFVAADGQPGDDYGYCVGMSDWLVVVGADQYPEGSGTAYAYNCQNPNNCTQIAKLAPPEGGNYTEAYFGSLLYVADDIAYIGAYGYQNWTGAVYIFNCSSKVSCEYASTLSPITVGTGDQFGDIITVYESKVVVGAQFDEDGKGAAYVFDCSDATNCMQLAYLTASDGMMDDEFGFVTAITENGIYVTAAFKDMGNGAMYTYWANTTDVPS